MLTFFRATSQDDLHESNESESVKRNEYSTKRNYSNSKLNRSELNPRILIAMVPIPSECLNDTSRRKRSSTRKSWKG
jgi:hypothetical protein